MLLSNLPGKEYVIIRRLSHATVAGDTSVDELGEWDGQRNTLLVLLVDVLSVRTNDPGRETLQLT